MDPARSLTLARRGRVGGTVVSLVAVAALAAAGAFGWARWRRVPRLLGYEVVASWPHDPAAYTQGLLWRAGEFLESTGRRGRSTVRRVEPTTGKVLSKALLPPHLFGEGLALAAGHLYQLTWTAGQCRVYDPATLALQRVFEYEGEGWGLTTIGDRLVMSDGTDLLSFRDPKTFEEVRRVRVRDGGRKVVRLNELEYITGGRFAGELWANVWKTWRIVRIEPETGRVLGWIDLKGIFDPRDIRDPDAVLNGIAFDPTEERFFVTGKLWPKLFQFRPKAP